MKKNKPFDPKFTCGLCLIFCMNFFVTSFFAQNAYADQPEDREEFVLVEDPQNQMVEIQERFTSADPYLVRRSTHAFWVGFDYSDFEFADYASIIDSADMNTAFNDTHLPLVGVEFGYKLNMGPISAIALGAVAGGSLVSPGSEAVQRKIEIIKYELGGKLLLDGVGLSEWVVPYAGASIYKFNIAETQATTSASIADDTQLATKFNFGIMIPLGFLDRDSASVAYMQSGVENTYLDLFVTQLGASEADGDPDTSTDYSFGAGIKLEF